MYISRALVQARACSNAARWMQRHYPNGIELDAPTIQRWMAQYRDTWPGAAWHDITIVAHWIDSNLRWSYIAMALEQVRTVFPTLPARVGNMTDAQAVRAMAESLSDQWAHHAPKAQIAWELATLLSLANDRPSAIADQTTRLVELVGQLIPVQNDTRARIIAACTQVICATP